MSPGYAVGTWGCNKWLPHLEWCQNTLFIIYVNSILIISFKTNCSSIKRNFMMCTGHLVLG
jgi:hypothetical protein